MACVLSTPFEVVKSRMQVQNELSAGGQQVYRSVPQALVRIARTEGLASLQKGLAPALCFQIAMNGVRFGLFPGMRGVLTEVGAPAATVLAAGLCGVLGACCSMPFYLVKCRAQICVRAQAGGAVDASAAVVGHQHAASEGILSTLAAAHRAAGIRGLFRGLDAACIRAGVGSASQLPSYHLTNEWMQAQGILADRPVPRCFAASMLAGVVTVTIMNPVDVLTTRLCNQPTDGSVYSGAWDCFRRTVVAEGPSGLFKGWLAHWCRLGPHTTYCFVFLDALKRLADDRGVLQ